MVAMTGDVHRVEVLEGSNSWTTLRQGNLALVAALVHDGASVSRGDLTRLSGLNRATVLDLVSDLQARGVLVEAPARFTGRAGRPTRELRLGGERLLVATADIRPTRIRIGVATLSGSQITERVLPLSASEHGADFIIAECGRELRELRQLIEADGGDLVHVTVGCPALIDRVEGILLSSEYLGWVATPVLERIGAASGINRERLSLSRLSNLAMKAEALSPGNGGAAGVVMLYSDFGVGVSGAVRHRDDTIEGDFDPGSQFGHLIVDRGGRPCFCGRQGCLEQYVGVAPFARSLGLFGSADDEAQIERRVRAADPLAARAASAQVTWLAQAIDALAVTLGVTEFVLGGLFSLLHPLIHDQLIQELTAIRPLRGGQLPVVRASVRMHQGVLFGGYEEGVRTVIADPAAYSAPATAEASFDV